MSVAPRCEANLTPCSFTYGIDRDDVDYIMETFPIVKRKDIQQYGTFRTKDLILQVYDAMAETTRSGTPYQTIMDPPPGYGPATGAQLTLRVHSGSHALRAVIPVCGSHMARWPGSLLRRMADRRT